MHLGTEVDVLGYRTVVEGKLKVVRVHTGAMWDHREVVGCCHGNDTSSLEDRSHRQPLLWQSRVHRLQWAHFSDAPHPGDVRLEDVCTPPLYQLAEPVSMATATADCAPTTRDFSLPHPLSPCVLMLPCSQQDLPGQCPVHLSVACAGREGLTSRRDTRTGGLTLIVVRGQELLHPLQVQWHQ